MPAQILYWGRLPAESATGSREAQDYRFERVLPMPVEQLHTTRARLPDGGAVVIGIEPGRLRSHLAGRSDVTPSTWELLPDHLPEHIAALVQDADSFLARLNLLHGPFEPEPRRTLRQRMTWVLNGGLVLAAALMVIGIERRATMLHGQAQDLNARTRAVIAGAVPPQAGDRHPELRLTMELRRLEQAAAGSAAAGLDALAALSALWRVWPNELRTQIEVVGAMQDRLVIRGNVPSLADAERLAQACRGLDPALRLRAQPLQAQVSERGASFLLTLVRQDAPAGVRP
jgi:hypothetical protein